MAAVSAQFPDKLKPLFMPAPYKVVYGGRGKGASWGMARALLILGTHKKLSIVCGREFQKSIQESVHKLLEDQISMLRFENGQPFSTFYDVQQTEISGKNGTKFAFLGLRNNIQKIKSHEGIDILWAIEATYISKRHWNIITPTVRRDPPFGPFGQGSEIWIDFNPDLAEDDTYKMFVVHPPTGAVVIFMNWRDNPFFPSLLRQQMMDMKRDDYDEYLNVWEGKTKRTVAGAIYEKEMQKAILDGRVVPSIKMDRSKGVTLAFDLGRSDMACWWAFQQFGMEHHAVDFYGNVGFGMDHYLQEAQDRRMLVKRVILPHDAKQHPMAARKSIEKQTREVYPGEGRVLVLPNQSLTAGINAVRMMFPRMFFNEETCADGLKALTHYKYAVNPETGQRSKEPLHNWASNPADALRTYVVGVRDGILTQDKKIADPLSADGMGSHGGSQGWMR